MDRDLVASKAWFMLSEQLGAIQASYELATCYHFGDCATKDLQLARTYYKMLAAVSMPEPDGTSHADAYLLDLLEMEANASRQGFADM